MTEDYSEKSGLLWLLWFSSQFGNSADRF